MDSGEDGNSNRRPIAARGNASMQKIAAGLSRGGITPNQISVASIAFAGFGAWALLALPSPWGPWLCVAGIQARLLCNLFDGMVAVEGGKRTATGGLYNEVPDRIADSMLIVALGYVIALPWLGWVGALLAALTAYVRTLGGALGQAQDFRGPMAKQHRMAAMTAACALAPFEAWSQHSSWLLTAASAVIAIGALLTCWTRLHAIATRLRGTA